jgi:hypothetical protein
MVNLWRRDISFDTVIPKAVASSSRLRMQISFLPFSKSEMKLRSIPTCSAMYTCVHSRALRSVRNRFPNRTQISLDTLPIMAVGFRR